MTEEEPVVVFESPRPRETGERALVLQSVGIRHEVLNDGRSSLLVVPAAEAARARQELAEWRHENRHWRPP
ncbi:MAG TPA: hypothetical protein VJ883_03275, partial [Woeseiaceae bacterium]|nr:hypothetical protein [Woeseiaceae bacterium]